MIWLGLGTQTTWLESRKYWLEWSCQTKHGWKLSQHLPVSGGSALLIKHRRKQGYIYIYIYIYIYMHKYPFGSITFFFASRYQLNRLYKEKPAKGTQGTTWIYFHLGATTQGHLYAGVLQRTARFVKVSVTSELLHPSSDWQGADRRQMRGRKHINIIFSLEKKEKKKQL